MAANGNGNGWKSVALVIISSILSVVGTNAVTGTTRSELATKQAVTEQRVAALEQRLGYMDAKLDKILENQRKP